MTAAWPVCQVALDRADQRRRLHAGQQMAEEALLGAFEGRARGRLRLRSSACRCSPVMLAACIAASRLLWMIGEGAGIGVVDADLLGRELMLDQLVFDAFVGQRAGRIEAERPAGRAPAPPWRRRRRPRSPRRTRRAWRTGNPRRPRGRAAGHRRDCGRWWRRSPRHRRRGRSGSACCRRKPGTALLRGRLRRRVRPCRRRRSAWRGSRRR